MLQTPPISSVKALLTAGTFHLYVVNLLLHIRVKSTWWFNCKQETLCWLGYNVGGLKKGNTGIQHSAKGQSDVNCVGRERKSWKCKYLKRLMSMEQRNHLLLLLTTTHC